MNPKLSKKKICMILLCFAAFAAAALGIHFYGRVETRSTFAFEYASQKPASGEGTEASPYLITNNAEFLYINEDNDAYYRLEADLTFENYVPVCTTSYLSDTITTDETNPTYAFRGHLDGGGHTIRYTIASDYYYRTGAGYYGLFGEIYGAATVKDLAIEAHIGDDYGYPQGYYAGALAGIAHGYGSGGSSGGCSDDSGSADTTYSTATFTNITVKAGSTIKADQRVGGLLGAMRGATVTDCTIEGGTADAPAVYVEGTESVGGFTGYSYAILSDDADNDKTAIIDSESGAEVAGNHFVGGIIGNAGTKGDNTIRNTYTSGTTRFLGEGSEGADGNYEYWGDVYGYQAKGEGLEALSTRINMENSGSRTTLRIKGDFTEIEGFNASGGVTFDRDSGTGETAVTATALFDGDFGSSGTTYYGCVSNYSGAYFRITRGDGKYVYVSVLDRTSGAYRHTIDVDLDAVTGYDPGELADPASVTKEGNTVTIRTASALEHFAWVSNGYIYDEAIGNDAAGSGNNDATDTPTFIIQLEGHEYDLTDSVGVWGEAAAGEEDLLTNGGSGHPNFYGLGTTTFAPFIGGLRGAAEGGTELKVYLNCPEGSFIGVMGAVSSNAGGMSATPSTTYLTDVTVRGLIRGKSKVGVVGYHDNYAPATLYSNDRQSTIEITNVTNYADIYGAFYAGGILGATNSSHSGKTPREARAILTNCHNYGDVTGTYRIGGVIGGVATNVATAATLDNVSNHGRVTGTDYNNGKAYNFKTADSVGGIAGYVNDHLNINGSVENTGEVSVNGTGQNAGGLIGQTYFGFVFGEGGSVANSGKVSGYNNVGGFIGYVSNYNSGCVLLPPAAENSAEVSGNLYVGGLIGRVYSSAGTELRLDGNYVNTAPVRGAGYVGGLIGSIESSKTQNVTAGGATLTGIATGSIAVTGSMANSGEVVLDGNSATLSTQTNAGGLIGYLYARENMTLQGEFVNTGSVTASSKYAGSAGSMNTAVDVRTGGLFGFVYCSSVSYDANDLLLGTNAKLAQITFDGTFRNEGSVSAHGTNEEKRNIAQKAGGIAGELSLSSTVRCVESGAAKSYTRYGTFTQKGTLESAADTEGDYYVGGIFGSVSAKIDAQGSVSNAEGTSVIGLYRVGGFAGQLTTPGVRFANGFVNNTAVTAEAQGYIGGLAGAAEFTAADGVTQEVLLELGTFRNRGEISVPNAYNEYNASFAGRAGGLIGSLYVTQAGVRVTGDLLNEADITAAANYVGGLIGYTNVAKEAGTVFEGTFANAGTVRANSPYANSTYVGGLFGSMDSRFEAKPADAAQSEPILENTGDVSGTGSNIGGIIGSSSYSSGAHRLVFDGGVRNAGAVVNRNSSTVGGIIGAVTYSVRNRVETLPLTITGTGTLVNEGEVAGVSTVGGIFGNVSRNTAGSLEISVNAENHGRVSATGGGSAGGIAGSVSLENSYAALTEIGNLTLGGSYTNTAAVSGKGSSVAGGIGSVSFSGSGANVPAGGSLTLGGSWSNAGAVDSTGSYTAGMFGSVYATCRTEGQITVSVTGNFVNEGEISGASYAGGFSGYFYTATSSSSAEVSGTIENRGNVKGTNYVGGLFGRVGSTTLDLAVTAVGSLENSGNVAGITDYIGGIAGYLNGDLSAAGSVVNEGNVGSSSKSYVGGIVGMLSGNFAADGTVENRGAVKGTGAESDRIGGIIGAAAKGTFSAAETGRVVSRGDVTASKPNTTAAGLFIGSQGSDFTVAEELFGRFAAYVTLGIGSGAEPPVSVTSGDTVYTTDGGGVFRNEAGEPFEALLGDYSLNKYTSANAERFALEVPYTHESTEANFVTAGFDARHYPLAQTVKIVKGIEATVEEPVRLEGETEQPWRVTVTTVYYDGTPAEGEESVTIDLSEEIVPEKGKYVYTYSDTVMVGSASVPVEVTLYYVPAEVQAYLEAFRQLNAAGAVSGMTTTATANYIGLYEKGRAALDAYEEILLPGEGSADEAFLSAYLGNAFGTPNTVGLPAGEAELYAYTDAIPDLEKGVSDGMNESGYRTGYDILSAPSEVRYGDTTAGIYSLVIGLYTLTNSGSGDLVTAGAEAVRAEGYYRIELPLTLYYQTYARELAAAGFSRSFTVYANGKAAFTLPAISNSNLDNTDLLTAEGITPIREALEGIGITPERFEIKLGLNSAGATSVTANGTTAYGVYLATARGSFKSSVRDMAKRTTNKTDAIAELLLVSVDNGEWLPAATDFNSTYSYSWTETGTHTVRVRFRADAEPAAGLANYTVAVNGTELNAENGFACEVSLTLTAASVELKWTPSEGSAEGNVFTYTGRPIGFTAVMNSTAYSYRLAYTVTDEEGVSIDGNTATDIGTYTIRAYAVTQEGEPVPESVLTLTGNTVVMTILPAEVGADAEIGELKDMTYSGQALRPVPEIRWNGLTLEEGKDFTLQYTDNIHVGTAGVEVTFIGNLRGSASLSFQVVPYEINLGSDAIAPFVFVYGETAFAGLNAQIDGVNGEKLTLVFEPAGSPKDAGSYALVLLRVLLEGGDAGDYRVTLLPGAADKWLRVDPMELTVDSVPEVEYGFDDAEYTVERSGAFGETVTVRFAVGGSVKPYPAGEADLTYIGHTPSAGVPANYTVSAEGVRLTIRKKLAEVTLQESYSYTGNVIEPSATYTDVAGRQVALAADFGGKVFKDAGTYDAVLKFAGEDAENYLLTPDGSPYSVQLTIQPAGNSARIQNEEALNRVYDGSAVDAVLGAEFGKDTASVLYTGATAAGAPYSSSEAPVDAGRYTVTFTIQETPNYAGASAEAVFVIDKCPTVIDTGKLTLKFTYNGGDQSITGATASSGAEVVYSVKTVKNAGSYPLTLSAPETANYLGAEVSGLTVVVERKAVTIDTSGMQKEFTYSGEEHVLSGAVSDGDGTITYSIGGKPVTGVTDAGNYTVTVTASETGNCFGASEDVRVVVQNADVEPTVFPEYDDPGVLYMSGRLPELRLGEGSTPGRIEWDSETLIPGTHAYTWTFTPDNTQYYRIATGSFTFTVYEVAVESVSLSYTGPSEWTYGDLTLEGLRDYLTVTAHYNDGSEKIVEDYELSGGLGAGEQTFTVTYEGKQDTFEAVIGKAAYREDEVPALGGLTVVYASGLTLSAVGLPEGFRWKEETLPVGNAGEKRFGVLYNADPANYFDFETEAVLQVEKAQYESAAHETVKGVYREGLTLGDLALEASYRWAQPDTPVAAGTGSYAAFYNADPVNYEDFALEIGISVEKGVPDIEVRLAEHGVIYTSGRLPDLILEEGGTAGRVEWNTYTLTAGEHDFGWTFTPTDTANFTNLTGEFRITVTAVELTGISAEFRDPQTVLFYEARLADLLSELVVTAHYNDGSERVVADYEQDGEPSALLAVGEQSILLRYGGMQTEFVFEVLPKDISEEIEIGGIGDVVYTGEAFVPEVSVRYNGGELDKAHYTVEYADNRDAGTARVIVRLRGNYTGSAETSFTIGKRSLSDPGIAADPVPDQLATGGELRPDIVVRFEGGAIDAGEFEITYRGNVEAGTAVATVRAREDGNFEGSFELRFNVIAADALTVGGLQAYYLFSGDPVLPELTVRLDGELLRQGTDYRLVGENNVHAGTASVTVELTGSRAGSRTLSFRIARAAATGAAAEIPDQTWNGSPAEPAFEVRLNGLLLSPGSDYTVHYLDNGAPGRAYATVTFTGDYLGTLIVPFRIAQAEADAPAAVQTASVSPAAQAPRMPELPAGALPEILVPGGAGAGRQRRTV